MKRVNRLFDLSGRTIVVAGGSGQIGFSFCEILADAGASIAIADIDIEMGRDKIGSLNDVIVKDRISTYYMDVSQVDSVKEVFKTISDDLGNIYGLVNCFHYKGSTRHLNPGTMFFDSIEKYSVEAWDRVHDINLKGSFLTSQSAIPYFKDGGRGVIVNISSTYGNVSANQNIYGDSGINSPVAYATSKAALINLTRYQATHLAEYGIRANCLSPGGVFNNQSMEFLENYSKLTPLKRMAEPREYQGAILFLMSDASSYMTGANLVVDGGWTAW